MIDIYAAGVTAVGAYMTYSGIRGIATSSENKSYSYEMAKVALGAAILGHQIDVLTGGDGLAKRVTSLMGKTVKAIPEPTPIEETASTSKKYVQPSILVGSKPGDFDPAINRRAEHFHMGSVKDPSFDSSTCDLAGLKAQIKEHGGATTHKLFNIVEKTKGLSCDNYLPWKDSFHAGGTGYIDGVRPDDLSQSVMWGIDPWQRPFVAIRHTCDKVTNGAVAFFQRYTGSGPVVGGGHHMAYQCMSTPGTWGTDRDITWLTDLLEKGSAEHPYLKQAAHLA